MDSDTPYVCTLADEDVPARTRQVRQLAEGLRGHDRFPGRTRLRFAPELADVVEEFVRDESDCCAFYEFGIDELDDEVQLTVHAPPEAQPLLDRLSEVFGAPGHTATPADEPVDDGDERCACR